jgi:hypothetical protein|tara:strand:+ start:5151 stop:5438 length:288 start_codon:yes stop_codon:yes gene_type:complete
MVSSEIKDLKDGAIITLPSNARGIVLEIALDGATGIQLQISHDKTTWHNFGTVVDADGLLSYNDSDEHFLQYVKVVVTGTMGANGKLNLYFGRSK